MPGPGLVVLMLAPIAAAGVLAVLLRPRSETTRPLRGLWLVPPVVLATVGAMRLQAAGLGHDVLINRVFAATVLACCAGFLVLNREQPDGLVRLGVRLATAGAAANATAILVYGSMPVLAASARWLGSDLAAGDRPDPQYVGAHAGRLPALLLGDVLPVPGLDAVVSLGDLLLVPGCAILLAAMLAPLLQPLPAPTMREEVNP